MSDKPITVEKVAFKLNGMTISLERPSRHNHLINHLAEYLKDMGVTEPRSVTACRESEQGFLTSEGKFVNRDEARVLAIAAGQVKEEDLLESSLYSEDLWKARDFTDEEIRVSEMYGNAEYVLGYKRKWEAEQKALKEKEDDTE